MSKLGPPSPVQSSPVHGRNVHQSAREREAESEKEKEGVGISDKNLVVVIV